MTTGSPRRFPCWNPRGGNAVSCSDESRIQGPHGDFACPRHPRDGVRGANGSPGNGRFAGNLRIKGPEVGLCLDADAESGPCAEALRRTTGRRRDRLPNGCLGDRHRLHRSGGWSGPTPSPALGRKELECGGARAGRGAPRRRLCLVANERLGARLAAQRSDRRAMERIQVGRLAPDGFTERRLEPQRHRRPLPERRLGGGRDEARPPQHRRFRSSRGALGRIELAHRRHAGPATG
jgi:hypothetical protein